MVARRKPQPSVPLPSDLDEPRPWDDITGEWFGMGVIAFEAGYARGDLDDRLLDPRVLYLAARLGLPARSRAETRAIRCERTATPEQWAAMLEAEARRYFGMSAEEFILAYRAGAFDDDPDRPHLQGLVMMFPAEP